MHSTQDVRTDPAKANWRSRPLLLLSLCGLMVVGTIGVGTTVLLSRLYGQALSDRNRELQSLALAVAAQTERTFQAVELVQISVIERLKSLGITSPEAFEHGLAGQDIHLMLRSAISALPYVAVLCLTSTKGKVINLTRYWPAGGLDVSERDYVVALTTDDQTMSFVSRPMRNATTGASTVYLARKVIGPTGELLGLVGVGVDLQYFERVHSSILPGPGGSMSLFRSDGVLLARSPHIEGTVGRTYSAFARALGDHDRGTVRITGRMDGQDRLLAAQRVDSFPLVVVAGLETAAALADWQRGALQIAGATGLIMSLIGGALFLGARHVAGKLRIQNVRFEAALHNMSQGLAMFDQDRRLVVCNLRYAEVYGLPPELVKPGVTQRMILEHRIANGAYPGENPQRYLDDRVAIASSGARTTSELELRDGRVIFVAHQPMPDGGWLSTHEDITWRRTIENELRTQNLRFETALDNMVQGLSMFDAEQRLIVCNERYARMYGLPPELVKPGTELRQILAYRSANGSLTGSTPEEYPSELRASFEQATSWTKVRELADGRAISLSFQSMPGGGWVATHEDVTRRIETERQLEAQNERLRLQEEELRVHNMRFETALDNMAEGLCMFDADKRLAICNRRYAEMYRLPPELLTAGTPHKDIIAHRVLNGILAGTNDEDALEQKLTALGQLSGNEGSNRIDELGDGRLICVTRQPMPGGGWVATHEDVTEQQRSAARIIHMAKHDALTELPNRTLFRERLEQVLAATRGGDRPFAVFLLDLDGFKDVNDTHGHPVGDALLKTVAERLRSCVRETDTVARLGGDEFAIIQSTTDPVVEATAVAKRVLEAVGSSFDLDGRHVAIGVSLGITIAPLDATDVDQLMRNADLALYRAKSDGRGTYRFFELQMDVRERARRKVEGDLRNALVHGELALHYQPLINLERDQVCGFEALLRWNHPERGSIPPAEFIAIAEETGLIQSIGEWVLREACGEAATWPKHLKVAINLSPAQFKHGTLVSSVISALAASGLPAQRLELEITESVMLQDSDAAFETLTQLHDLGVRIALDDFGTGYSSLSYLRKFPFDKIKIDRSFVEELSGTRQDSLAIVRSVVRLALSLGIETTAEGVETKEQLDRVRAEGCTEVQGYYYSRPIPAAELPGTYFAPEEAAVVADQTLSARR